MQIIEGLTDAEIAEAHHSADIFAEVSEMTAPLDAFMSLLHAFDWLGIRKREVKAEYLNWIPGMSGDPIDIAQQGLVGGGNVDGYADGCAGAGRQRAVPELAGRVPGCDRTGGLLTTPVNDQHDSVDEPSLDVNGNPDRLSLA